MLSGLLHCIIGLTFDCDREMLFIDTLIELFGVNLDEKVGWPNLYTFPYSSVSKAAL